MKRGVILIIRDGWGFRSSHIHNAVYSAKTPNTDFLMSNYPNVLIDASGRAVGLPESYQGNSEVGHMTIGSGRIIFQALERINQSIVEKSFFINKEFLAAINNCKLNNSKLHIAGLIQVEGVHSHLNHLFALLDLCKEQNFFDVVLHLFTDGRDAPVTASLNHVNTLEKKLKELRFGFIATISGRYYAMDRDKRWDRTRKAYDCIVNALGEKFEDVSDSIINSHRVGVTDEFIMPISHKKYDGLKKNDSFIFFNFRTDRPRQLTKALVEPLFTGWLRKRIKIFYVGMTHYYKGMNGKVAFSDEHLNNLLGEVVSKHGFNQLRISETEKYAHVTFFFNGQVEKPFKKESRILVSSPNVATYDLKPEMSIFEVTNALVKEINKKKFELIVVNLVNSDMVGHTGNVPAIVKAVEVVDSCVGKIVNHGLNNNYDLLIFADHGNAEDQRAEWRTSHTINPVPFIVVSNKKDLLHAKLLQNKGLKDVAPTVLKLLGISKPDEMSGESIIDL